MTDTLQPLDASVLPAGIRARHVPGINGLTVHLLEAGEAGRPILLLLHGFPELAFSWRKVMPTLAEAGYHVIAPDLRGYGRTLGWTADYDGDLSPFRPTNMVRDAIGLVFALGQRRVAAVVGHDYGASVAAWSALIRPDIFPAVALMSAPFAGPAAIPFGPGPHPAGEDVHAAMLRLARPRKHYQWYYSTRPANDDMWRAPQGVHAFLRGYYHHKSADWADNRPFPLAGWTAEELAKMPTYYIMDAGETMAETVAHHMPTPAEIAANRWLPDHELAVYAAEYGRTGFQGGLQLYRVRTTGRFTADTEIFTGRSIDQPSVFISGAQDWGIHQSPGAIERMNGTACTAMRAVHLIEGAGHWVQQEQAAETARLLLEFLRGAQR
ncbi:MAG: alpha/beta fold hydrolase [Acetobacteraceae bacterium]|nr:alpha/beta fold hydrolase [Acetobacteraceae bacterium]